MTYLGRWCKTCGEDALPDGLGLCQWCHSPLLEPDTVTTSAGARNGLQHSLPPAPAEIPLRATAPPARIRVAEARPNPRGKAE